MSTRTVGNHRGIVVFEDYHQLQKSWGWVDNFAQLVGEVIVDLSPTCGERDTHWSMNRLHKMYGQSLNRRHMADWHILLIVALDADIRASYWLTTGRYPNDQMLSLPGTVKHAIQGRHASRPANMRWVLDRIHELRRRRKEEAVQPQASAKPSPDWSPNTAEQTRCDMSEYMRSLVSLDHAALKENLAASGMKKVCEVSTPLSPWHPLQFAPYTDTTPSESTKETTMNQPAYATLTAAIPTANRSNEDFTKAYDTARPGSWVEPVVIGYDPDNGSPIKSERVFKPSVIPGNELVVGMTYRLQTVGGDAPHFVVPGIAVTALSNGDGFAGDVLMSADASFRIFVTDETDQYTLI